MYRYIRPESEPQLAFVMLFEPTGYGTFFRACEADSWRGLVAAILDDPAYETAPVLERLVQRLRLAEDVRLLAEVDGRSIKVGDRDAPDTVNVASDEPLIRSLDRLGLVSLDPSIEAGGAGGKEKS